MTPSDKPTEPGGVVERLAAAEVGSRELDAMVEVAVRAIEASRTGLAREHWAKWRASSSGLVGDPHTRYMSAPVTTSLDAALALAERVLPGWEFGTYINRPDKHGRRMTKVEAHRWQDVSPEYAFACASSQAPTPALALCLAILRAHPSDEESK